METKRRKTAHSAARTKRRLRQAAPKVARARSSDAGDITSKPMLLGYARVSTVDQNLALQRDALTEAGCTKIFTEQMAGAVTDRPALHDALEFARSGDTLIVWKLDRLARSMKQLIETVETLRLRGIGFRSLTEALDTTTAQGRLVFPRIPQIDWTGRTKGCGNAGQTADSFFHPSDPSGFSHLIPPKSLIQLPKLTRGAGRTPFHPGNPGLHRDTSTTLCQR